MMDPNKKEIWKEIGITRALEMKNKKKGFEKNTKFSYEKE